MRLAQRVSLSCSVENKRASALFLSNSDMKEENKPDRMGRWGWSPGAGMQKQPPGTKCGTSAWGERARGFLATPWGRTSLWLHRSPSRQAWLGHGTPQTADRNADTTAVQGLEPVLAGQPAGSTTAVVEGELNVQSDSALQLQCITTWILWMR